MNPCFEQLLNPEGLTCPELYGVARTEDWCAVCLAEYNRYCDQQADEYTHQLMLDFDRPVYSYHQITQPTPN